MRVKRFTRFTRCVHSVRDCVTSGGNTPDQEVLPAKVSNIDPRVGDLDPPKDVLLDDSEEQMFTNVLRMLEVMQEHEAMSVVGSIASDAVDVGPRHSDGFAPRLSDISCLRRPDITKERLTELLQLLRQRKLPSEEEALQLVNQTREHLRENATALVRIAKPSGRLVIVGDLHGHLNDLLRLLDAHGPPSAENQYLFNGDFVDRGDWGPEVLMSLYCLRLLHPEAIHLNRGNHECQICTDRYGFYTQLMHTYPQGYDRLYDLILDSFNQLPLAHVIGGEVFVVHGGLPEEPPSLADIEALPRGPPPCPVSRFQEKDEQQLLFEALLWSDPAEETGPSARGAGNDFGEDVTRKFLEANGLRHIVRSHECVPNGVDHHHNGLVTTVFSASNYNAVMDGNQARVLVLHSDLSLQPGAAWTEPYIKAGWVLKETEDDEVPAGREWDAEAEADASAVAALQQRLGTDQAQWQVQPRNRALDELRRQIFLSRTRLLQAFEVADAKREGLVSVQQWAGVMATVLNTPKDFPWVALGKFLHHVEPNGHVAYMEFLLRYDNPFSRWLAERWCIAMLSEIACRLGDEVEAEFDRLDVTESGRLSYSDLRPLIHETVPQSGKVVATQSMHVFALLQKLDPAHTGFVTKEVFRSTMEHARQRLSKCPQGHIFQEQRPTSFKGHVHERACDACHRIIPREITRRHCSTCDYDLCEYCAAAGQLLNIAEFRQVRLKRKPTLGGTKVQVQWDNVQDAIRKLCEGRIDVRALFRHLESGGDGYVNRSAFVSTMAELLRSPPQSSEALWALATEHCGSWNATAGRTRRQASMAEKQKGAGQLKVEEFVRCLAVMDCCPTRNPKASLESREAAPVTGENDQSLTDVMKDDHDMLRVSLVLATDAEAPPLLAQDRRYLRRRGSSAASAQYADAEDSQDRP